MTDATDLFGQPDRSANAVRQLPLPLGWRGGGRRQRLLIGEANSEAVGALDAWASWPRPLAVLSGPEKSGKSLLGAHFGAICPGGAICDPADDEDENELFHACNRALESGQPLLLIVSNADGWQPTLPDLATRVRAAYQLKILEPDTALFSALLVQKLAIAGLPLSPDVASFIADRADRTYASLNSIADVLTSASKNIGMRLTTVAARQLLINQKLIMVTDHDSAVA